MDLVRSEVVMMIVRNEHKFVSRTCGSVRSSLSAPARLVTVGSEAAETTSLRRQDEGNLREEAPTTTSVKLVGETGWMKCPTQVNCRRHRHLQEPKTLTGSDQNGMQSGAPFQVWGHTDARRLPVYRAGAYSFVSSQSNTVNPALRLLEAGVPARGAVAMAGRGSWRKQRPSCNGADRSCNMIPPCKRADFQQVVRYERTGRTYIGGNRK